MATLLQKAPQPSTLPGITKQQANSKSKECFNVTSGKALIQPQKESDKGVSAHASVTISLLSPPQHMHEIISKVKRAHVSTGEQLPERWGNLALDTWYHTPFASVVFWD